MIASWRISRLGRPSVCYVGGSYPKPRRRRRIFLGVSGAERDNHIAARGLDLMPEGVAVESAFRSRWSAAGPFRKWSLLLKYRNIINVIKDQTVTNVARSSDDLLAGRVCQWPGSSPSPVCSAFRHKMGAGRAAGPPPRVRDRSNTSVRDVVL